MTNQYGKDPTITQYLNNLNIVIIPVVNPDGYEYTRSGGGVDVTSRSKVLSNF